MTPTQTGSRVGAEGDGARERRADAAKRGGTRDGARSLRRSRRPTGQPGPFFTACALLVVVWLPTTVLLDFNTSQLLINTPTTIVTFLLVALLQNTQTRNQQATQRKLNAIADGLADLGP
jgi:Low affinity iron permease